MMEPTASEKGADHAIDYSEEGAGHTTDDGPGQHPKELAALVLALELQRLFFPLQYFISQLDRALEIRNN